MASLNKNLQQYQSRTSQQQSTPASQQSREQSQMSAELISRVDDLQTVFKNEDIENLKLFAMQFSSKEEMDTAVRQLLDDGSSLADFLADWNVVTSRQKKPNPRSSNQRGNRGSRVSNPGRNSQQVQRSRLSTDKPSDSPKTTQNPFQIVESSPTQKSQPENRHTTQLITELSQEQPQKSQTTNSQVVEETKTQILPVQTEERNKKARQEAQPKQSKQEFTQIIKQEITDDAEVGVQFKPSTRTVGIQVAFESGIPCLIYPIHRQDLMKIEHLINPSY